MKSKITIIILSICVVVLLVLNLMNLKLISVSDNEIQVEKKDDRLFVTSDNGVDLVLTYNSNVFGLSLEKNGIILLTASVLDENDYTHNVMRLVGREGQEWLYAYDMEGEVIAREKMD